MDAESAGDDYEEDEEEGYDEEEETDGGGEETVDATHYWTDEEVEATLTEVRKWIAWQGYVPLKQLVWRGPRFRRQSRPLSSRRLDKMRASLRLTDQVAEVETYLLDRQGICACSVALSSAFYG